MRKKQPKSLETKLRSALRLIWSRSKERREILKKSLETGTLDCCSFTCPVCHRGWPIQMAEVDHEPPLGPLLGLYTLPGPDLLTDLGPWTYRLFFGPQRAICKLCHRKKTAEQRRKKK